jgi:hypothetical protein
MAWTVWTSPNTLDAYITVRPMRGGWKISLHKSGSWQSGFTAERFATTAPDVPSRHWDIWERPDEFAPGMRRGVHLMFPDTELRRWPDGNRTSRFPGGAPFSRSQPPSVLCGECAIHALPNFEGAESV